MREVYAIQHNKTKRVYIGSSGRTEHRLNDHIMQLRRGKHSNKAMQKDFDSYGEDYSFFKIDVIPTDNEKWREYYWMGFFGTWNPELGYNTKEHWVSKIDLNKFERIFPYGSKGKTE